MFRNCFDHVRKKLLLFVVGCFMLAGSKAQLCPPNLDFENGDFSFWQCRSGFVSEVGGINTLSWSGFGVSPGRHTIIPAGSASIDPYGLFPQSCPNGSGYSIKLGNNASGAQAESVSYFYTIPSTITSFSIIYYYAVVFQDPGHSPAEQPRFTARVIDLSDNSELNCVSFDFTSSGVLPGFQVSSGDPSVLYKDWTPVTLDLSSYAGKTIQIEFITSDCTRSGHFGYAYVDVNASCNSPIIGTTICDGDTRSTLVAPFGFESYQWYAGNNFLNPIGSSQTLILDPLPAVGSVYPVIVRPYPTFGCEDTLYAVITRSPRPVSFAGLDESVCRGDQVRVGTLPTSGYNYSWTPASNVTNALMANPFAFNNTFNPLELIVKTTDLNSGCFSYDTTYIRSTVVDTSLAISGLTTICAGEPITTNFIAANSLTSIQWYNGYNPIPGATSQFYQPSASGSYLAYVTQNGCVDSTRRKTFTVGVKPQAAFTIANPLQCENSAFTFTNTSSITPAENLQYLWKFSDGSSVQVPIPTISFVDAGDYTVELVVTSNSGCKDSTKQDFKIVPNAVPDFKWDSICVGRDVQFTNLTNENGNSSVTYHWDFQDGNAQDVRDPLPFSYSTPGTYTVSLNVVATGCESAPKSIVKTVRAKGSSKGIRYQELTVPEGYTRNLVARDTIGNVYDWTPKIQLNNYSIPKPLFTAVSDVEYFIKISDGDGCTATDTMMVRILKEPGIYLPTAFTPNGDGRNDLIRPYLIGMKSLKRFSIYNRNGNLIFSTAQSGEGWNGQYRGAPLDAGVFVYYVEYVGADDKPKMQKGTITLVR